MSKCDELFGLNEGLLYFVKCLMYVDFVGYWMIGVLYGYMVVGVFIVIVFVMCMLFVVLGVELEVMDLLLMLCVIKLLIDVLKEMVCLILVFVLGFDNFVKMGVVDVVFDLFCVFDV